MTDTIDPIKFEVIRNALTMATTFTILSDRDLAGAHGLFGGLPGARSESFALRLNRGTGARFFPHIH